MMMVVEDVRGPPTHHDVDVEGTFCTLFGYCYWFVVVIGLAAVARLVTGGAVEIL
jgi:hypothetical protein